MAASLQLSAGATFSSSFLQKLSNLVQSIQPNSFQAKPVSTDKQSPSTCRNRDLQFAPNITPSRSNATPVVPRLSLEVPRSELDERSEALDLEIQDLMAYWESWSYLTGGSRTSRIGTWERGHPLDLNDEFIREDPNYDEEKVNQEALRDYLKETSADGASGRAARRNRGSSATEDSDGGTAEVEKRPAPTRGRPRKNLKGVATFKKPRAVRSRASTSRPPSEFKTSSSDDSGEEGKYDTPTKKKKPLGSAASGRQDKTPMKRQTSADKNNRLNVSEQKVSEHSPSVRQPTPAARAKRGQARDSGELKVAGIQGKFSVWKKTPASPVEQQPSGSQLEKEAGEEGADPQEQGARDRAVSGFQPGPDPPSKNPGKTSGSPSGQWYNLRRQSGTRGDAPQKEERDSDGLSSATDSDEEWSPDLEGSPVAEEEEGEEGSDGDEEEEINTATDTGPVRHAPVTPKVAPRSYPCPECGREFSNSSNMWKHLRIHRKEFPFSCHACGKSYSDPSNLAKHQLSHGGERQHKCPQCPKAFFLKFQLDAHIRRHQGIRPFPCLDCKSSFFSRAELSKHIKIHSFGKGYQHPRPLLRCTDCDKTFAGSKLLRKHQKRHRSFPCEVCGQVFTLKFKYLVHLRSHKGSGESGGATASGAPLSRSPATLTSTTRNASAPTVPGNVAHHSPDAAAGARHLTKTPGPAQAHKVLTSRPSLVTRPPFPINSHGKAFASTTIQSKPPPMPVLPRLASVASTNRPEIPSSAGRLFSPGSVVVPAGFLLATQAGVWPPNLIQAGPFAMPVILVLPNGSALPSGSNPNERTTVNTVRLLDPSTPPAGAKLSLELPGQKIVMAQTCQLCHVEYLGKHHCRASRSTPATSSGREESKIICLDTKGDTTVVHPQPSADLQPPPETQGEQEPVAHRLRQAGAQVVYTNQAAGDGSDSGGSSEDEWRPDKSAEEEEEEEEEEPPAASVKQAHLRFSTQEPRGSRRTRRRRNRYMCSVCDKRFVHQRSLKQHMRLHFSFSCNLCSSSFLRSEQLSWHMLCHAKENRT